MTNIIIPQPNFLTTQDVLGHVEEYLEPRDQRVFSAVCKHFESAHFNNSFERLVPSDAEDPLILGRIVPVSIPRLILAHQQLANLVYKIQIQPICSKTLTGHTRGITIIAITPDGRHLISGSNDETLKIWDIATGACIHTLTGHTRWIITIAITPDGRHLISGSEDKTLKIWDIATGACIHTLTGHTRWIITIAITPDGRHLISGSWDNTLKIWDIATGACIHTLTGHTDWVRTIAITPDGRHLISGSGDTTLKIWDIATGACIRTLTGPRGCIVTNAITPDGRHLISGSEDNTPKIWDIATGACIHTLTGHTRGITTIAITPDGRHLISGSWDNTLKIWDIATGACIHTLTGHTDLIKTIAITPDGRHLISGSWDNTLKIWDTATGACIRTLTGHTYPVISIAITPDGRHLISGSGDNTTKIWSLYPFLEDMLPPTTTPGKIAQLALLDIGGYMEAIAFQPAQSENLLPSAIQFTVGRIKTLPHRVQKEIYNQLKNTPYTTLQMEDNQSERVPTINRSVERFFARMNGLSPEIKDSFYKELNEAAVAYTPTQNNSTVKKILATALAAIGITTLGIMFWREKNKLLSYLK